MGDLRLPWGPSTEEIYVLGSGFHRPYRHGSILRENRLSGKTLHPNEKPIGLLLQLLECCPEGSVVADPFAGAGSTLLACKQLGIPVIGVEIEREYCEIIVSRLAGVAVATT